ncbi:DUF4380 domain-containing protein [Bacteroides sp. BFG-638]|uniref:DUF4380 domain-containing protein n=1 Tax=Bacteroides vicugnae TaxID=3037989 RepID=A0ABU5HNY6_9BACE|nr:MULTISPECIES: DUF4380 domain-containing protein [unclassified Bacteroides]MCS2948075.1 DUF4380 domain-containing protein [Bacteroides sp. BFG-638]MCS3311684.1 DUF4380 domain-containing protein [Bacteroides sp. BFG-637]MDY7252563.1 DUF4380 domain-containing protein [Bacteroides sp. A1-P5]MDY7257582.1 DUF4380 domain-containing protein [Bacteroides sp. A2-P53]
MRSLKLLLYLFISCLCFGCKSSLPKKSRINKQNDVYVLSFADLSFSVSAKKGGRIISFKCRDKELLTSDLVHSKYYGATFWLSPQSNYWPQYRCIDELPYKAEIDGQILRLVSSPDSLSGISIIKEFSVSERDSSILINYSVRNVSCQLKRFAPWDVVRVHGGLSFFPVGEADQMNKSDVTGAYEDKGIMWVPCPDGTNERGQKLYSTAYEGWIAHYYKELLFIKCFPDIGPGEVPPGQGEAEIFVAPKGRYLELENHGRYTELPPGESLVYQQKWFLKDVSDGRVSDWTSKLKRYIDKQKKRR